MPGSLIAKWGRIKTNRAKIRRAWLGKWGGGGGENGRESPVSPQPSRVSRISFYTFLTVSTERLFTTILGAWNRIPFVQISSIYWKTAAKAWNWYQISVCNISSGKTGLPFQVFRCSRKFSVGKTQEVVFHALTFRPDFPEHFCKWWLLTIYKYFRPPRSLILPPHPRPPFSGKKVIFTKPP